MRYDFTRREAPFGRKVFVLTLDRKAMTERVIIGEAQKARRRLEYGEGDVLYDETRPLGSLLFNFEADSEREWNVNAMRLHESYGKIIQSERWKMAKKPNAFLRGKYNGGELADSRCPAAMFAAIRTWDSYLNCFNQNDGPQKFIDRTSLLYRPFFLYGDYRPWKEEAQAALAQALRDEESQVELWYPVKKRPYECIVTFASFQPVIFYYLQRIEEWGLHFMECGVCGKDFLAPNRHYAYCSDPCRKARMKQNKKEYDERIQGDRLERLHRAAYEHWYNHVRRLRRGKAAPETVAAMQAGCEVFRKEAVRQKAEVKNGTMPMTDFTNWLARQYDVADRLAEELTGKTKP